MKKLIFILLCFSLLTFGSSARIIEVAPAGAWGSIGISGGGGAVAAGGGPEFVVAGVNSNDEEAATTINLALGTDANRYILVGSVNEPGVSITDVTFGGVSITGASLFSIDIDTRAQCNGYGGTVAGSGTADVVVTFSAATGHATVVAGYSGVSSDGTPATATGNSTAPSVSVSNSDTDELIVDVACQEQSASLTVDGSQTQRGQTSDATWSLVVGVSEEVGSASPVSMDWTGADERWGIGALALEP